MPEQDIVQTSETLDGQPVVPAVNTQDNQELFDGKPFNAETAKDLISKLRKENREFRTLKQRMDEYEKAEQARKEAELSETEKLSRKLAAAEQAREQALQTANQRLLRAAFVAEAAVAGAEFPDDAFRLADTSGVTVDDDGNVLGVKEAVKAIVDSGRLPLKNKRQAPPNLDAGAGNGQRVADTRAAQLTEAELEMARKMRITPEQYAASKVKR